MGMFTLIKKNLTKFWHYQNFSIVAKNFGKLPNFWQVSYIVNKIWQQIKFSHFFDSLTKIW